MRVNLFTKLENKATKALLFIAMNNLNDFPAPLRIFDSVEYQHFQQELAHLQPGQSSPYPDNFLNYLLMNYKRSSRVIKSFQVSEVHSKQLSICQEHIWYLITEPWCGDAAHSVPVIMKLAEAASQIHLNIILRDENPVWMEHFLTNGGKSIPVLAVFDEISGDLIGHWGPRPNELQQLFMKLRTEQRSKEEIQEILQKWYNTDKGNAIVNEVLALCSQTYSLKTQM